MAITQAGFLRQRAYLAVSITHFFVDVLNSGRTLLVAILAISIGLTNAQVGIALLLYNVGSALSQPLFGWLADRAGPRWLVVGGMGWMMLFYGLAAVVGDWPALAAVTLAGLGSGAFHPTGTMVASQISHTHRNRATAVFFMIGQLGLFSGPILAGILLEQFGRPGYLVLPLTSFIAFAGGWQLLVNQPTSHHVANKATDTTESTSFIPSADSGQALHPSSLRQTQGRRFILRISLLGLIIICGSTVSISAINFAPKLFTELGYDPGYVGLLGGLFMLGSAMGGVVGGALADRVNGKWVIALGVLGSTLPIYFYIPTGGIARFGLLLLAGFFSGMPHSILVIMVQSLLPGRRALASGLALGFMFFSGSVGSYALGVVADEIGLALALRGTAVLPLIAAVAAPLLPRRQT